MLMPVVQIRPVGVIMLHRFVPVRVRMIPILIYLRCIPSMNVIVMMKVIMGVAVRVVQHIMGVQVCVLL